MARRRKRKAAKPKQRRPLAKPPIKISELRAEGIVDIGMAYAFPYVRTTKRLVLVRRHDATMNELRDQEYLMARWRELRDIGWRVSEIADMYGVSAAHIFKTVGGDGWEWTPRDYRARARRDGRELGDHQNYVPRSLQVA